MEKQNLYAKKVTLVGFGVNAGLTGVKIIAGIFGRSGAMVADGIHSLSDVLTDLAVLIGLKYTEQPADDCHNYGHEKYETLVTASISIFLFIAGYEILKTGILHILQAARGVILPQPEMIALFAAILSIITKELMYRYTVSAGKKLNSPSVVANAWHHRSDAFSSLGTLFGIGGAILLGAKWTVLDPLASVLVSVFIFRVAYQILRPCINELTESSLSVEEKEQITAIIKTHPEVKAFHKLRSRKIGNKAIIEMHILVDEAMNIITAHNIATELEAQFKEVFDPTCLITIHVEPHES